MSRSRRRAIAFIAGLAVLAFGAVTPHGAGGAAAQTTAARAGAGKADGRSKFGIGREAKPEEVAGWDIDVRPDGQGLPPGRGTALQGEKIFIERCAACHGEFGQGNDRWPVLAGGLGSLTHDRPEKTIGSFWPAPSTAFDYIRRAMPYGDAQSLSPDDIYAIVAYLLHLNDVVKDTSFELNETNFASIKLPNASGFYDDDRETAEKHFWRRAVCMTNCKPDAKVTGRAMVLDVTPETGKAPKVE